MKKVTDAASLLEFSRDAGLASILPKVAYRADTEEDVAAALTEAAGGGLAVTPRGGGTGIPTQSVGRGAILLQDRAAVEVRSGQVVCEPGIVKAELNRVLAASGLWMPVDPSSYASCTVGGMVANNSSGVRTVKYGSTVDYVEGLRVAVLGEGVSAKAAVPVGEGASRPGKDGKAVSLILENRRLISEDEREVTKNSSGYRLEKVIHDGVADLPKLFAGSEGTLGVVTQATLRTAPKPEGRVLFVVEASIEGLGGAAGAFRVLGPSALELVDKSVFRAMGRWDRISKYSKSDDPYLIFCEFDGTGDDPSSKVEEVAESKAASLDPMVVAGGSEIAQAWDARNETLGLAQHIRKGSKVLVPGVEDLVAPPERLGELVRLLVTEFERRGLEYIMYGHAGDANLHARPLMDPSGPEGGRAIDDLMEDCFEGVWRLGGSITGEHGDGMLRAKFVERQYPKSYWLMKELKQLYDPKGLLNPGVKVA